MKTEKKLTVIPIENPDQTPKSLDFQSIETIIGRPYTKAKLIPPYFEKPKAEPVVFGDLKKWLMALTKRKQKQNNGKSI